MKLMTFRQDSVADRVSNKNGASRINVSPRNFAVKIGLGEFLMLTAIIVSVVVFYGSFVAIDNVLEIPISQIEVEADLDFQARHEITEVINGHIENGFVRVDLELLRLELMDLPWVYQVGIRRKLPQGLVVELIEEKPLAYWNDKALINSYGDVFSPEKLPAIAGLPKFRGQDEKKVLGIYQQLKTLLPQDQQPIKALIISEQDMVVVRLSSETELVLSIDKLHEQVKRWNQITAVGIGERLPEVRHADLRYSNGAAIQWKNIVASRDDAKAGVH